MDEAGPVQLKTFSPPKKQQQMLKAECANKGSAVRGPDPYKEGERVPMHRPPCQGLDGWDAQALSSKALQDGKETESYR